MAITKNKSTRKVLLIVAMALLIVFVVSMIFASVVCSALFPRFDALQPYSMQPQCVGEVSCREVSFNSAENKLCGYVYTPKALPSGVVIIVPGRGSGAVSYVLHAISFAELGWQVLVYDPTGINESEGESSVGFSQSVTDLESAISYVKTEPIFLSDSIMVFGHSCGGYAACIALGSCDEVMAIVSVGGFNSIMEAYMATAEDRVGAFAYSGYVPLYVYQLLRFGSETTELSAVSSINSANRPALIVHGIDDSVIPYDNGSVIAHMDEIVNPYAEFYISDEEGNSGHVDVLYKAEENNAPNMVLVDMANDFFSRAIQGS